MNDIVKLFSQDYLITLEKCTLDPDRTKSKAVHIPPELRPNFPKFRI